MEIILQVVKMTAEEELKEVLNLSDECISKVRLEIRGECAWSEHKDLIANLVEGVNNGNSSQD